MMARDEIDIIESNIRYHLAQGISRIIVTDNGSVDGTRDLLAELSKSAPVTVLDEDPADWSQGKWVTRMARMAYDQFGARWVINTDADEFFVAPNSTLRSTLEAMPKWLGVLKVSRNDFVSIDRPRLQDPPLEMLYRKRESLNPVTGLQIMPKAIHRGTSDILVNQGCHDASARSFRRLRRRRLIDTIVTSHYPIRSFEQFESKVRNAGSGYAINVDLSPGVGAHKRQWYRMLQDGKLGHHYAEHHHYGPERLRHALNSGEIVKDLKVSSQLG